MKKIVIVVITSGLLSLGFFSCRIDNLIISEEIAINTNTETTTFVDRVNMDEHHEIWRSNRDLLIVEIKNELTEKGWIDVRISEGSGESRHMFLYSIIAQNADIYNPITIWVGTVFNEFAPEGSIESITYVSESGQRYQSGEILHADDPRLYENMRPIN